MRFISKENLALFLILIVVISRLVPHPPNFTPVLSIALFAGAMFQSKWKAFAVPVAGLILSNIVLGFQAISWVVIGIMVAIAAFGFILKSRHTAPWWVSFSIASSLVFFIISNFFVWVLGGLYPPTPDGLLTSYIMAIPFYKNMVISTLLYSLVLFEGQRFLEVAAAKLTKANQEKAV